MVMVFSPAARFHVVINDSSSIFVTAMFMVAVLVNLLSVTSTVNYTVDLGDQY